jgi:hypothetical protein
MDKPSKDQCSQRSVAARALDPEVDDLIRELGLKMGIPSDDPKWLNRKLVGKIATLLNPKVIESLPRSLSKRFFEVLRLADQVHRLVLAYLIPMGLSRVCMRGHPRTKAERDREIVELARQTQNGKKKFRLGQIARKINARYSPRLSPQAVARVLARAREKGKAHQRFVSEEYEPLLEKIADRMGLSHVLKSHRRS